MGILLSERVGNAKDMEIKSFGGHPQIRGY